MTTAPQPFATGEARCMIWRDAPVWDGLRTAAIGQFNAPDAASGAALLKTAVAALQAEGFQAVIGPMDGDTWHSYRLIAETDGSPPFLMEPHCAAHALEAFTSAGFAPISRYVSSRTSVAAAIGDTPPFVPEGITIRAWDGQDADRLIGQLFAMSSAQFARNAFFKPISMEAFLGLYRPVMAAVDPRLVLFAFDAAGAIVGFLFGMPNHLEGPKPRTAILKTYASGIRGVGRALADHFHRTIRDLGYTDVIHALMHESNVSLDRSAKHNAAIFRRYALMGLKL